MEKRLEQVARYGLFLLILTLMALLPPAQAKSAPYAAMVIDARTGEVLHSRNADTRLHPASLTKMMTLYIAFEAVENGEISLDTLVKVSSKAANEPPSKLGLKAGQKIKLRYLIRAAAVKSANDAATAIGEAISGSEAAFARRMNRTAKALGMNLTTFKNAHGLTESGHLSTARDMTTLGRHLFYDWPEYYNLFSRQSANAGIRSVSNTNRRFLSSFRGADGIKTGYTSAAGFNLVASAERGQERIIATMFGGVSSSARNAKVSELLNLGFKRAPTYAKLQKPRKPAYSGDETIVVANGEKVNGLAGKTIRTNMQITKSVRPLPRPGPSDGISDEDVLLLAANVQDALVAALPAVAVEDGMVKPLSRPGDLLLASVEPAADIGTPEPVVVTRVSTSGGRHWGINLGRFSTEYEAERILLRTALIELATLDEALRKVVRSSRGFEANFVGLSEEMAALACRRLSARSMDCEVVGPR